MNLENLCPDTWISGVELSEGDSKQHHIWKERSTLQLCLSQSSEVFKPRDICKAHLYSLKRIWSWKRHIKQLLEAFSQQDVFLLKIRLSARASEKRVTTLPQIFPMHMWVTHTRKVLTMQVYQTISRSLIELETHFFIEVEGY